MVYRTVILIAMTICSLTPAGAEPVRLGGLRVVDGDTVRVGRETIRLVGLNAPETGSQAMCERERTLCLSGDERAALEAHADNLRMALDDTPSASEAAEGEALIVLTKMLLALPAGQLNEAGAQAKGEAYMAAVDDLPIWAIKAALRSWYRGEAGGKHDYRWAPGPAEFRAVVRQMVSQVRIRLADIERLLSATPRREFDEEHRLRMAAKFAGLLAIDALPDQPMKKVG